MQLTDHPSTHAPEGEASFSVYALWERMGITEHLGGGTGYAACLLAREYQAQVTAADLSRSILLWLARRGRKADAADHVTLQVANAESLPFPDASFAAVIAESVLVFCDARRAAAKAHRVLRPGGVSAFNELTFLQPPPPELRAILASAFVAGAIRPRLASEWVDLLRGLGFPPTQPRRTTSRCRSRRAATYKWMGCATIWRRSGGASATHMSGRSSSLERCCGPGATFFALSRLRPLRRQEGMIMERPMLRLRDHISQGHWLGHFTPAMCHRSRGERSILA